MFRTYIKTTETNRTVSKQTETNRNNPKFSENTQICSLSNCLGWSSVCFGSIETFEILCFGTEAKQLNQTVSKQTEKNQKIEKTEKL
jgi:hypothetical protein